MKSMAYDIGGRDWSVEILIAVTVLIFLSYEFLVIKRSRQAKNKDAWQKIAANFTKKENVYMKAEHMTGAHYKPPKPVKEYQIEYTVNGKTYLKYITEEEAEWENNGKIDIEYLKKRPSTFRVV